MVGGRDEGYLPLTNAAAKAMEASGHYAKNPNQNDRREPDELRQDDAEQPGDPARELQPRSATRSRSRWSCIFSGNKAAKQGLDDAESRKENEILKEFAALYK